MPIILWKTWGKIYYFLDQLWKYDSATKVLENKNGDWLHLANTWTLPSEGEEGNIKDVSSAQVLGLSNDATDTGTEVVLEDKDLSLFGKLLINKPHIFFLTSEAA